MESHSIENVQGNRTQTSIPWENGHVTKIEYAVVLLNSAFVHVSTLL